MQMCTCILFEYSCRNFLDILVTDFIDSFNFFSIQNLTQKYLFMTIISIHIDVYNSLQVVFFITQNKSLLFIYIYNSIFMFQSYTATYFIYMCTFFNKKK